MTMSRGPPERLCRVHLAGDYRMTCILMRVPLLMSWA